MTQTYFPSRRGKRSKRSGTRKLRNQSIRRAIKHTRIVINDDRLSVECNDGESLFFDNIEDLVRYYRKADEDEGKQEEEK